MEFLHRHKRLLIVLVSLLCAGVAVATVGYRFRPSFLDNTLGFVLTPAQEGMTGFSRWFAQKTSFFTNIKAIEEENKKLTAMVDALTAENRRLKLAEAEAQKLSALLQLDEKYADLPKVGAEIIAKDPSNWFNTFIINKGTSDGLTDNMMVMAAGGVVGRIIKASATYSEVITILDDDSAVSAKCTRTEDLGLVKGDLTLTKDGLCRMDFIEMDAQIMEGDELITSHLGDIYPPGILVGYVKEVRTDAKGLTKYALVEPTVDFQDIETVLVVTQPYSRFRTNTPEQQPVEE